MSDDTGTPSTFKPRSFEERKRAEEEARKRNNQSTKQSYRLRERPGSGHARHQGWKHPPMPDTGGKPTRDMPPVPVKLRGQAAGEPCEIVSLSEFKHKQQEKKQ